MTKRLTAEQVADHLELLALQFKGQARAALIDAAMLIRIHLVETREQRRERFEAWRRTQWGNLTEHDLDRDEDGTYASGEVQDQFAAFNAGATWNAPASDGKAGEA